MSRTRIICEKHGAALIHCDCSHPAVDYSNPLPTDLISMAADGRLKSSQTYLELIEDKVEIESDIASMEQQLLLSDRTEEWRNTCLYNLGCARNEIRSVSRAILQIEELCRVVCKMMTDPEREKSRQQHAERMMELKAKKAENTSKPHTELLAHQAQVAAKNFEEKTKRYVASQDRDLRRATLFKKLVKPILGEERYNELCTQATELADAKPIIASVN